MKRSHSHVSKTDDFPITPCPEVFYSFYIAKSVNVYDFNSLKNDKICLQLCVKQVLIYVMAAADSLSLRKLYLFSLKVNKRNKTDKKTQRVMLV